MCDEQEFSLRDWFRKFNWDACYESRLRSLRTLLDISKGGRVPPAILETGCKLMFQACRRGRYRAVWDLFVDTLLEDWHMRGFAERWEWIRTRILRRLPDPAVADADRFIEETKSLDAMAKEL